MLTFVTLLLVCQEWLGEKFYHQNVIYKQQIISLDNSLYFLVFKQPHKKSQASKKFLTQIFSIPQWQQAISKWLEMTVMHEACTEDAQSPDTKPRHKASNC